jgi:hypothetical protein
VLWIHCGLAARSVHRGAERRWWPKLTGARPHRRSCAWDLAVVAWGGREGDGNPYPVGMRQQRGSSGRPLAMGGGGGASSMRRCSGRGGEGRRRAVNAVWRGRGEVPFIGSGRRGGARRPLKSTEASMCRL